MLQRGYSALILSAANGHAKVVANLISAGANLNIQDKVSVLAIWSVLALEVCV